MSLVRALAIASLSFACASVPRAPDWYADGPTCEKPLPGGARRYCASALADDAEGARSAAVAVALAHAAGELETEVQAKLVVDAACVAVTKDGSASSSCSESVQGSTASSTRRLAFRDVKVEQLSVAPESGRQRAWTVVQVPSSEWRRVARAAKGKLLVAVDCQSEGKACPAPVLDALTSALTSCGVAASGGLVTDVATTSAAVRRALDADAAKALFVTIRATSKGASDGLQRAEGGGRWELIESGDGKVIASRGVPTKPATTVQAADALEKALKGAVERLSMPSCGLADAQGSLCCAGLSGTN